MTESSAVNLNKNNLKNTVTICSDVKCADQHNTCKSHYSPPTPFGKYKCADKTMGNTQSDRWIQFFKSARPHCERDQLISCLAALKLNVQLWASQEEKLNKWQAHSQNITCYKNKYRTIHNCHNFRRKSETLYLTQKQQNLQILPSKFVSFLSCRVTFHSHISTRVVSTLQLGSLVSLADFFD